MTSAERVEQIKARLSGVQGGAWWEHDTDTDCNLIGFSFLQKRGMVTTMAHRDCDFIANAPDDVAWLLDQLEDTKSRLVAFEAVAARRKAELGQSEGDAPSRICLACDHEVRSSDFCEGEDCDCRCGRAYALVVAAEAREAEALKRVPAVKEHYCGTERVLVAATFSDEFECHALLYTSEGKPFDVPMADVRSCPDE